MNKKKSLRYIIAGSIVHLALAWLFYATTWTECIGPNPSKACFSEFNKVISALTSPLPISLIIVFVGYRKAKKVYSARSLSSKRLMIVTRK